MIYDLGNIYYSTLQGVRTNYTASKTLDKDAFLRLLLQELEMQDPLEPMETKDMISQLSQLTSLEQITNLTSAVKDFVEAQTSVNPAQLASLIGKYVVVKNNEVNLKDGEADSIIFNLDEDANVVIQILDENGNLVRTEDLGSVEAGVHGWQWDGRDDNGVSVEDGTYTYHVYKVTSSGLEEIGGMEGGLVEAVQIKNGEGFVLVNGSLYPVDSILEISQEGDA
ncbi:MULTISPECIES: flagellar hook assembly protein FlgD [Thermotoga]|uniref:Basal-body rod modification protein FlgD n=1 Tax=Thermotoga neapolitana (strain ATCC 49049 / DSM 4359 / NBRC 107923 / NS-E) TaxID=309803 RepID=B9KAV6_THENN|nr:MULTISPECIES: flagellar hook assembly protein FlgD [Thermotoga]MDK2786341.1 flagellar basal-body rod modification protein FlgD [Thermotoga sp.]HBF11113.1 flagellar hook assembly protein FlgD [Thermotoga neapolitana]ACM24089.1 Basal-body rod modification protein FlgD [Thermotoga neapolitana DSM 4359]AJG40111.1 flagellar hook capping protein FlgD [Thermotoga sp. RQ7]KFZ20878.1 Basal-body rod modification protein FlgD [Thermotoga neapolitana LA10]